MKTMASKARSAIKKAPAQARQAALKMARQARDLSEHPQQLANGIAAAVGGAAGVVAGVVESALGNEQARPDNTDANGTAEMNGGDDDYGDDDADETSAGG
jgi:hypothetical protein